MRHEQITVGLAGEATCTITNDDIAGHIVVDKVTVPAGSDQVFDFTVTGTGYSNFSLTDAAEPNSQQVNAGLYTVVRVSARSVGADRG